MSEDNNNIQPESDDVSVGSNQPTVRRSTRVRGPPKQYEPKLHGKTYVQVEDRLEYTTNEAKVLALSMCQFEECMSINKVTTRTKCCNL